MADCAVYPLDFYKEIGFNPLAGVDAMRLDEGSEEGDSLGKMLKIHLPRMESEFQVFGEKQSDFCYRFLEIFTVLVDEDEIIDVSSVVTNFEFFLDECVEFMEVEIRENLTREVADRETGTRRSKK